MYNHPEIYHSPTEKVQYLCVQFFRMVLHEKIPFYALPHPRTWIQFPWALVLCAQEHPPCEVEPESSPHNKHKYCEVPSISYVYFKKMGKNTTLPGIVVKKHHLQSYGQTFAWCPLLRFLYVALRSSMLGICTWAKHSVALIFELFSNNIQTFLYLLVWWILGILKVIALQQKHLHQHPNNRSFKKG